MSSECTIVGDNYLSGSETSETVILQITAIPITTQYRPPRVTRKPIIPGAQTAFVVEAEQRRDLRRQIRSGEGPVQLGSHWKGRPRTALAGCAWRRSGPAKAGGPWRSARIGHEVIVDFLEGDPDQSDHYRARLQRKQHAALFPAGEHDRDHDQEPLQQETAPASMKSNSRTRPGLKKSMSTRRRIFNRVVMNDESIDIKQNRTKHIREGNETINIDKGNRATDDRPRVTRRSPSIRAIGPRRSTRAMKRSPSIRVIGRRRSTRAMKPIAINTGGRGTTIKGDDTLDVKEGNVSTTIDTGNDTLTIKTGNMTIKLDQGAYSLEGDAEHHAQGRPRTASRSISRASPSTAR